MAEPRCYMVVFGAFTDYPRFMSGYQVAVEPLIAQFGGKYLLVGQNLAMLEGDFPAGGGAVMSVWPNRAAALAFWHSAEYAAVKKLRNGTGEFQVALIDEIEMSA